MKLDALPFGIVITLLVALPSYFNLSTQLIFEEEKSLLLRAGALMALPALMAVSRADTRRLLAAPVAVIFAALVGMLVVASIVAIAPDGAVMGVYLRRHGLLTWLAVGVLFVAMLGLLRSPARRDLIVAAVSIGAIWPSMYLLLQRAGLDAFEWIAPSEAFKAGGTFGNHVLMGGYLALVIPLTALKAWRSHSIWGQLLLLELLALGATASRGAALAVAAGAATAAAVLVWRFVPRRAALALAGVLVVAAGAFLITPSLRPQFLNDQFDPRVGSARVRMLIWQDAIDIVRSAGPRMLFGHGPESFRLLMPAHYSPEIGYWERTDAMPDRAHNETLEMTVSAGFPGAVLQLALFATMLAGALRIDDVAWRCALSAALVGHIVEIQFGLASVTTRLLFMTIGALVVGMQFTTGRAGPSRIPYGWLSVAALIAAASPALSIVPSIVANPVASGGEAQFIAYLRRMSMATPLIYGAFFAISLGLARSLGGQPPSAAWWRMPAMIGSIWIAAVTCIAPSRADALAAAGHSYELEQRWPEARAAFAAAVRAMPAEPEYRWDLARTALAWGIHRPAPERERLFAEARVMLEQVMRLRPLDVEAHRRHAAIPRIRAAHLQGPERDAALREADRAYAAVSAMAPTWTPVWIEWGWVDVDRGLKSEAIRKLERALALNDRHPAAKALAEQLRD